VKKNLFARIILFPFTIIYGSLISLRNIFYEAKLLRSTSFSIPVINVGNLSMGGTGKTPHIEQLIRVLSPYINVSTLSRGYKRKTKGFRLVSIYDDALAAGDEPLQFKTKFPEVPVAVSESRNIGIPMMLKHHPEIQTVLLDDAFQHRSVIPGLNILLSAYDEPFYDDYLLPMGRLREPREAYKRADVIIVTKCPEDMDEATQNEVLEKINPLPHQEIYFSRYKYKDPYFIFDKSITTTLSDETHIVLISAIANVDYLIDYLADTTHVENIVKFEDHHYFSDLELEQFRKIYENIGVENAFFLTTEKDAMRLALHKDFLMKHNMPIFVLPVEVSFLDDGVEAYSERIKQFLIDFKV